MEAVHPRGPHEASLLPWSSTRHRCPPRHVACYSCSRAPRRACRRDVSASTALALAAPFSRREKRASAPLASAAAAMAAGHPVSGVLHLLGSGARPRRRVLVVAGRRLARHPALTRSIHRGSRQPPSHRNRSMTRLPSTALSHMAAAVRTEAPRRPMGLTRMPLPARAALQATGRRLRRMRRRPTAARPTAARPTEQGPLVAMRLLRTALAHQGAMVGTRARGTRAARPATPATRLPARAAPTWAPSSSLGAPMP